MRTIDQIIINNFIRYEVLSIKKYDIKHIIEERIDNYKNIYVCEIIFYYKKLNNINFCIYTLFYNCKREKLYLSINNGRELNSIHVNNEEIIYKLSIDIKNKINI